MSVIMFTAPQLAGVALAAAQTIDPAHRASVVRSIAATLEQYSVANGADYTERYSKPARIATAADIEEAALQLEAVAGDRLDGAQLERARSTAKLLVQNAEHITRDTAIELLEILASLL